MSNVADDQVEGKPGWFARLRQGLAKTRDGLSSRLDQMFAVGKAIDQTLLDEIETCLLYTSPSPRDNTTSRMPSSA